MKDYTFDLMTRPYLLQKRQSKRSLETAEIQTILFRVERFDPCTAIVNPSSVSIPSLVQVFGGGLFFSGWVKGKQLGKGGRGGGLF